MRKRQRLGQHFLKSPSVAKKIVDAAGITKKDVVLEIGTGKGILVPLLCKKASKVISIESDLELYNSAKKQFLQISNLTLRHANGFKSTDKFTIFVSNLPYSKSKKAMEWLVQKKFSRAIVMVQEEFANKLLMKKNNHRAISVLVNYATNITPIINVNKINFLPQPKVNSTVIKLTQKKTLSMDIIQTVNKLFSYKRKKLKNVLKQFGQYIESEKRIENLTGDEIIKIAKSIKQK